MRLECSYVCTKLLEMWKEKRGHVLGLCATKLLSGTLKGAGMLESHLPFQVSFIKRGGVTYFIQSLFYSFEIYRHVVCESPCIRDESEYQFFTLVFKLEIQ